MLLARARRLLDGGGRVVLGICGAPGAGKSTLAASLVAGLGDAAVVVPMDGFHLSDEELARRGLSDRKGAPETFDVEAYVALLRRLRAASDSVWTPAFDRDAEATVPDAIEVGPQHRLVVTEGNYLLLDQPGWREVPPLLDECWYVEGDDARVQRLIDRHVRHGRSRDAATEWVLRSDEANARLVAESEARADFVIRGSENVF